MGGGLLHRVRTLLQWDPETRRGGCHNPDPLRALVWLEFIGGVTSGLLCGGVGRETAPLSPLLSVNVPMVSRHATTAPFRVGPTNAARPLDGPGPPRPGPWAKGGPGSLTRRGLKNETPRCIFFRSHFLALGMGKSKVVIIPLKTIFFSFKVQAVFCNRY